MLKRDGVPYLVSRQVWVKCMIAIWSEYPSHILARASFLIGRLGRLSVSLSSYYHTVLTPSKKGGWSDSVEKKPDWLSALPPV